MTTSSFLIQFDSASGTLKIGFNPDKPSTNVDLVQDAAAVIAGLSDQIAGTPCLKINGPASLPVAFVLAHALCHIVGSIAVFDPKLGKHIVTVSHNPDFTIGATVD